MSLLVAEEQLRQARAWAAQRGLCPRKVARNGKDYWKWDSPHEFAPDAEHTLPDYLWAHTPVAFNRPLKSEEGAYWLLAHGLKMYDDFVRDRKRNRR